jgi:type II secretory pathway pseudopilin PulG
MKRALRAPAAFSLVEVTLALGVAAFAFVTVLGMLPVGLKVQQTSVHQTIATKITSEILADMRAAVRTHGNSQSSNFLIKLPNPQSGSPWSPYNQLASTDWFTNEGDFQQNAAGAVFTANIYYMSSTATTALTRIVVYWPSAQTDSTKVAGSTETIINVNRPAPP